jgi:hypothetical protein
MSIRSRVDDTPGLSGGDTARFSRILLAGLDSTGVANARRNRRRADPPQTPPAPPAPAQEPSRFVPTPIPARRANGNRRRVDPPQTPPAPPAPAQEPSRFVPTPIPARPGNKPNEGSPQTLPPKGPAPGRDQGSPDVPFPIPATETPLEPLDEDFIEQLGEADAQAFVDALRRDNVPDYKILAAIADVREVSLLIKQGGVAVQCRNGADENARRLEVVYAVDAVRRALGMADWPMDAIGYYEDQWKGLCAFEAIVFLACPEALVEVTCSVARAKLRNMFGTRTLCGWVDTALLCTAGPVMTTKYIAVEQFLVSVARSVVDIQDLPAIQTGARNVSLSFAHGLILSRVFMLVEQLLLSNAHTFTFREYHRRATESGVVACAEIERDGRLAHAWCSMLFDLIYQKEMPGGLGDYQKRYPSLFSPSSSTNKAAQYIRVVYNEAKHTWFAYTQVLPTALYLVQENVIQKYNSASIYEAFTGLATSIRSCLGMQEAKQRFDLSKTYMPLRIAYAKTQFVTVSLVHVAGSLIGTGLRYSPQIAQLALLASSSAVTTMMNAPLTTAVVGTGVARQAMSAIREVNSDMAQYLEGAVGNATAAVVGAASDAASVSVDGLTRLTVEHGPDVARVGVRVGTGITAAATASAATAFLNTEAVSAAAAHAGVNVTEMIPSTYDAAMAAMRGVEGREGVTATVGVGTAIGVKYAVGYMGRMFYGLATKGITKTRRGAGVLVGTLGAVAVPVLWGRPTRTRNVVPGII